MKNLLKYAFAGAILVGMASCEDDEQNVTDFVQETVERGAVLRTTEIISNELPIGIEGASFSIEVEEQDQEDGDLLESVDVFARFTDNSEDDGDTTGASMDEFFIFNIPASEFTDGPFGLPRTVITVPLTDLASMASVSEEDLFGGDTFTIRLSLNLTDGRVFSSNNAGSVITGGFFNSPFTYNATVTCPVMDGFAQGDYALEITSGVFPDFGATMDFTEGVYTIVQGDGATARTIQDVPFLPEFGSFVGDINFNLVCGQTITPQQALGGGVGCGGAIQGGSLMTDFGMYDPADDTVFTLGFRIDALDSGSTCPSAAYSSVLTFTKQ